MSTAVTVTAAVLVIRKVLLWQTASSDSTLHEFFTDRLSYILAYQDSDKIASVKASFIAMLNRSRRFGAYSRRRKRAAARIVMLHTVEDIVGESRNFIERLYDEFGFAAEAMAELHDRRWWKRAEAVRELRMMRVKRAAEEIAGLLSDQSGEVKLLAFEAVIDLEGISSLPVLAGMLREVTTWNAINFARIITDRRHEAAPYIYPLLRHTDVSVRSFAVRLLGILRSVDAVPALIRIAGTGRPAEMREALIALGLIGDGRAVDVCSISLGSSEADVRIAAAIALGSFGAPETVSKLASLLEDGTSDVRLAAGQALLKCGDDGTSALKSAISSGSAEAARASRHVLDDQELSSFTPVVPGGY
jgi:HEAT repeats